MFALRDLKVKYSQTYLGVGWSLLQPITSLVIYSFVFGYVLKWSSDKIPYTLYVLSGLLGWNFFMYVVSAGAASIQESSGLIKKIYFPKSILPLSKTIVASVDLVISLVLMMVLMIYYGQSLSWHVVFVPFVLLFNALCGLTVVYWLASFAYRLRDLFHLVTYLVYFGIWITPVFFTPDILPKQAQYILGFNPVTVSIDLWRWAIFPGFTIGLTHFFVVVIVTILCFLGMYNYNKNEINFSDYA